VSVENICLDAVLGTYWKDLGDLNVGSLHIHYTSLRDLKSLRNQRYVCPICDAIIVDSDEINHTEDAVYCEGDGYIGMTQNVCCHRSIQRSLL